jgi:formate hydrogenlyase subunit 3/multisubunit Na+/H+ antiporter MnhD subunit
MNAPVIWIGFPGIVSVVALIFRNRRFLTLFGGVIAVLLASIAYAIPIDQALQIGSVTLKINPTLEILGRRLIITANDAPLLGLFYGMVAMWIFGAEVTTTANRLVPLGLAISALMVASLAVEPFLYAAILIEIAILLAIPLLTEPGRSPGPGLMRFLIYQTLGMPFILFSGWLLAGVEASPGDFALAVQSAAILGMGFAFLLAVFPFYTWMPMLAEEVPPYILGFILWVLPTISLVFGLGFLDRYAWIRTADQLGPILRTVGLIMIVTGGLWSAFQRHLGRQMAYGIITETGFSLVALSLPSELAIQLFFLLLVPRSLGLLVWALCLESLAERSGSLHFHSILGMGRLYPISALGLTLAYFSVAGYPLLAGFPIRLALWSGLAGQSLGDALWLLVGSAGLLTGATRMLGVLVRASETASWDFNENWVLGVLVGIGIIGLFLLGFFPQITQPLIANLPAMFEHLGK